jgi:arylsulfatase A-like enzyme/Flp pilus assembly protein TadD
VGLAICGLLLAFGCESRDRAPGLVLITIDTCRADRVGVYGRPGVTPHLEALAARGTVFLDASAPVPLTLPSHVSILTGLYPDRHGVRDNGSESVPAAALTLAEVLREAGWQTGAFVAAFPLEATFGLDQGFDVYDDSLTASSSAGVPPGGSDELSRRLFYDERTASQVTDAALPWLRRARSSGAPFFLWVHYFDPHATYRPPAPFAGTDPYQGEITYVDSEIGRLLAELEDDRDRVTVCVTADHGESLGEHGEVTHALFVYRSTLRVPWILAGPHVPQGSIARPVSIVQVAPTLLDALRLPDIEGLDGSSALAEGESEPVFGESLFARLHYDWAGLRTIRDGRWKLIDAPTPELYDLETDPDETSNVAAANDDLVRALRAELVAHGARGGALAAERQELDDAARARLEGLGYVGGGGPASEEDDLWNPGGRDPKEMVDFFNRLQNVPTLMIAGRNDEADRVLQELRRLDPGNRNVLEKLALLRKSEGRLEEAKELCERILQLDPMDEPTRLNLASVWVDLGDVEAARREYRTLVEQDPQNAAGWRGLATVQRMAGDWEEALASRREVVAIAPNDPEASFALAGAWEDKGEVQSALEEYDRALRLDPTFAAARNGKALLLSHHGRPNEAVEVLRGGLAHTPTDLDTLNNLAWILTNERIDPAGGLRLAREAMALAPDDPSVLDTFGWSAVRAGHPDEAVPALERAWRETQDAEVRAHLGVALAESGRAEDGRAHLAAAVAERPELRDVSEVSRWLP